MKRARGGNRPLADVRGLLLFVNAARPAGFWNERAFGFAVVLVVVVACVVLARCNNGDRRVVTVTGCDERGALVGWNRFELDVSGRRNFNSGFWLRRAFSVVVAIASSSSLFSSSSLSSGLASIASVVVSSVSGAFVVVSDGANVGFVRNRT